MRFLVRNIPPSELFLHFIIISIVLTSWGFLFYAAFILPLPTYAYLVILAYARMVAPDPIFPGANSAWCFADLPVKGFVAPSERSTASFCQINFSNFTDLCTLFGVSMTDAERSLFFNTLDITGNGVLSVGELGIDYFNTSDIAFTYYVKRWRQLRNTAFGGGLTRIQDFDYEPYRYVYSDCFIFGKNCRGSLTGSST
jgi:hypothetical protein